MMDGGGAYCGDLQDSGTACRTPARSSFGDQESSPDGKNNDAGGGHDGTIYRAFDAVRKTAEEMEKKTAVEDDNNSNQRASSSSPTLPKAAGAIGPVAQEPCEEVRREEEQPRAGVQEQQKEADENKLVMKQHYSKAVMKSTSESVRQSNRLLCTTHKNKVNDVCKHPP